MGLNQIGASKFSKGLLIVFTTLTMLPIAFSPLTADDIPNSNMRIGLISKNGNFWFGFFDFFKFYNSQWMNSEGRFFPGAILYGEIVHSIFQGRGLYKFYLALLGCILVFLIWKLLSKFFDPYSTFIGTLFFISSYSLRYKYFHDGISSFQGLVPFVAIIWILSIIVGFSSKQNLPKYYLSIFLYTYSILTYEHVLLFLPAALIMGFILTQKLFSKFSLTIFLLSLVDFIFIYFLRVNKVPNPAYQLNFDLFKIIRTSVIQFVSAFPNSQILFAKSNFASSTSNTIPYQYWLYLLIFLVLIIFSFWIFDFVTLFEFPKYQKNGSGASNVLLICAGANLAISPAIITGLTLRWQNDLYFGQGYLCLTLQALGLAVMISYLANRFEFFRLVSSIPTLYLVLVNIIWNYRFIF